MKTTTLVATNIGGIPYAAIPVLVRLDQLVERMGKRATTFSLTDDPIVVHDLSILFPSFPRPPAVIDDETAMDTALYDMRMGKWPDFMVTKGDGEE